VPGTKRVGGFQPQTAVSSARRADFDLLRRVAELERIVDVLADRITVGSPIPFSFNAATTEPIVGNQLRVNNASQTAATRLWVSHSSFDGLDVRSGFDRVTPGDVIYFQDFDDSSKWVRYLVASKTDDGAYHDFVVSYTSGPANVPFQKIALRILFQGVS
jgi:hypothetical protein